MLVHIGSSTIYLALLYKFLQPNDYVYMKIEKAKTISANAHTYIEQFKNQEREDVISVKVLQKYFKYSSQLKG
jgi:hypothetical protein